MTCDKITYNTYKEAQDAIHGLVVRKQGSFRVYKCNEGNHFHVTTIKKKRLQKVKYKFVFKPEEVKETKRYKPVKNKIHPNSKSNSIPLATEKLLSPLQAQILKGKIAAHNRTTQNNQQQQ